MTSFAAEFPIDPKHSAHDVAQLACRWITGSPHSEFEQGALNDFPLNGERSINAGIEVVTLAHSVMSDGEIAGLRYERSEESLSWTTSIVSLKAEGKHILRMEVVCEALTTLARLPPPKKPYFIKQALKELGGGDDGAIPVTDQPFFFSEGEEEAAANLILGTANNSLPIVYISASFNNQYCVEPKDLARFVGGLAHVIVEPSRAFSLVLRKLTASRNVFGGAVGVYWPNSRKRHTYSGEQDKSLNRGLAIQIAKDIRVALSNMRQSSNCTWAHLKEAVAKHRYEQLKAEGSTEINQYVSAFDDELSAKQQVIAEREQEIARLNLELRRLNGIEQAEQGGLITLKDEQDLYQGEIRDIVISELANALERVGFPNSRRAHVLRDLIAANAMGTRAVEMSEELKSLLRGYRSMDSKTRTSLERLGFDLSEDGKHWKAVFQGDTRYTFIFPKTGGDHRGGLNMVRDITNALF